MFSSILKTSSAHVYHSSSRAFSNSFQNKLADTIRQLTNNDNVIGLPQTVLAPAGAGVFKTPQRSPLERKDFMDFTGNVGTDDTSRVKKKEDEMNKAAAEATKKINEQDEANIKDRIENIAGKRKKDSAYKAAKEAGQGNTQSKDEMENRQYRKWTDKVDETGEPAYNRFQDAEDVAKEKDYDWAKKAEPPKHRERIHERDASETLNKAKASAQGLVTKIKEKVQDVFGKK